MPSNSTEKREKIFSAAKQIISSHGLLGFTMAALGEVTGFGMGTIYSYFPTKEDIIQQLYLEIQRKHTDEIFREIDFDQPFMVTFKQMLMAYFMDRWNNYEDYLFIDQYRVSPYESEEARSVEDEAFMKAYQLMERGKKELLVRYVDNRFLLTFIVGGIKDIIREMKRHDLPLDQQAITKVFELSTAVALR